MTHRTTLQFIHHKPMLKGWRLIALLVGVSMLVAAVQVWVEQKNRTEVLAAQLLREEPRAQTRRALSASEHRVLALHARAAATAVQQLNFPVARVVKALQPPADIRVALLSLDLNGSRTDGAKASHEAEGGLKITAEARTAREMMTYVAFLQDQSQFRSTYLLKHEINSDSTQRPYRFQMEATWRE